MFYQLHLMRVAAAAPLDNSIATCEQECSSGSPFCLRLKIHSAEQAGLLRLRQTIMGHASVIKSSDLLAMFNINSDPCKRSDTSFENGKVANQGETSSCTLETQLPDSSLSIKVPELLEGEWVANGSEVRARFDNAQTRAHLEFTNALLNEDWGGDITGVFSTGSNIGFSVGTKSCIRADLN